MVSDSLAAVTVTVNAYDLLKKSENSPIVLGIQVPFASYNTELLIY